jgi:MOSC domain-containing protein YiiM
MSGRVEAVNTSRGGVPKMPVFEAVVAAGGVGGDVQNDTCHHGGPDRAVTIFSLDVIRALQAEGHGVSAGSTGENLTISGVDWTSIVPGTVLAIGDGIRLEVTRYTSPCAKLSAQFRNGDFMRMSQKTNPGWSRVCARVLSAGVVRAGDSVTIEDDRRLSARSGVQHP